MKRYIHSSERYMSPARRQLRRVNFVLTLCKRLLDLRSGAILASLSWVSL